MTKEAMQRLVAGWAQESRQVIALELPVGEIAELLGEEAALMAEMMLQDRLPGLDGGPHVALWDEAIPVFVSEGLETRYWTYDGEQDRYWMLRFQILDGYVQEVVSADWAVLGPLQELRDLGGRRVIEEVCVPWRIWREIEGKTFEVPVRPGHQRSVHVRLRGGYVRTYQADAIQCAMLGEYVGCEWEEFLEDFREHVAWHGHKDYAATDSEELGEGGYVVTMRCRTCGWSRDISEAALVADGLLVDGVELLCRLTELAATVPDERRLSDWERL